MKATPAGRRRAFNQVSNMPVVIIESDRDTGEKDAKASNSILTCASRSSMDAAPAH